MNEAADIECPHCGFKSAVSTLEKAYFYAKGTVIFFHGERVTCTVLQCANADCKKESLWLTYSPEEEGEPVHKRLVPRSSAKPWPDYIPREIRDDYEEACLILEDSPNASAALARRCLQGMIRNFWSVKEDTLHREIKAIQNKVDDKVFKALRGLKDIGNIGAHPETVVDVTADDAQTLVDLLHLLVRIWYVAKKEHEQQLAKVAELGEGKKREKEETDINGTES